MSNVPPLRSSISPPDLSTLPETLRLLSLLWSVNAAMERTSIEMDARLGVTGPQRFLLRFVGLEPGVTRGRLAQVIVLDAADLRSNLDQLVARNMLTKRSDSGYYLTGMGAVVNTESKGTIEAAVAKALDNASPHERSSFRRMLERVLRCLDLPP